MTLECKTLHVDFQGQAEINLACLQKSIYTNKHALNMQENALNLVAYPFTPLCIVAMTSAEVRGENTPEKSCLNRGSNSQSLGHESDTLTTEPSGRGSL